MPERQPKLSDQGKGAPETVWRSAGPVVVAGLSAHLAVVTLIKFASSGPLLTALLTTLVFAAVTLACTSRQRDIAARPTRLLMAQLQAGVLAFVAIGVGAWLISRLLGTGAAFYCEPLVPWRIEIALFGSFAIGYLTFLARARQRAWVAYPLVMVALLWIAPFYGFFSAPLFLGISLNSLCPDRSSITTLLAAFGMIAGEQAGLRLAAWISGDNK